MSWGDEPADARVAGRVDALDTTLFDLIDSQTSDWDRRSLLALHAAAGATLGSFNYLEIGSYRGGSLQVLMQDPRCARVLSLDSRPSSTPDKRAEGAAYADNTTNQMLSLLRQLPQGDMSKLTTFEAGTDTLRPRDLPVKPDFCFIDGEHTDDAALRDARFCLDALEGCGLVAFHDYGIVKPAIRCFLRETWAEITRCVVFVLAGGGGVFALEVGDRGILRQAIVDRAVASRWHSWVWRVTSTRRSSPIPFLLAWSAVPLIDAAVTAVRRG